MKTASEVGQRYFRKFFKKDCFRVRSRWLLGAGNSDPGRSLILEIAGDASINLKWRNSYPRRMTTWSCASRWRGREGGKSLAFFNGSSGCLGVLEFIFENFLFKQKFSGRHREMRARARVRWQRKDLLN